MKILRPNKPPGEIPVLELVPDGFVGRSFNRRNWAGTTLPGCAVILYYLAPDPLTRVHDPVAQAQGQPDFLAVLAQPKVLGWCQDRRDETAAVAVLPVAPGALGGRPPNPVTHDRFPHPGVAALADEGQLGLGTDPQSIVGHRHFSADAASPALSEIGGRDPSYVNRVQLSALGANVGV